MPHKDVCAATIGATVSQVYLVPGVPEVGKLTMNGPSVMEMLSGQPWKRSQFVHSPTNLAHYLAHMNQATPAQLEQYGDRPMILHEMQAGLPCTRVVPQLQGKDMATLACDGGKACRRCATGQGGFKFPWIGYWTPDEAIPSGVPLQWFKEEQGLK
jgi:hypothetical protein